MARIFFVLAIIAVVLLAANFLVGLTGGDFNAVAKHKRESQNRLTDLERQRRANGPDISSDFEEARQAAAAADAEFSGPRARMTLHMLLGSAAALVTVLVNSITITYFIGTSRWCREVGETYSLPAELIQRSTRLKRATFPWALAGIMSVLMIIGLGAAADPSGANWAQSERFIMSHYLGAMIGLVVIAAAFWVQGSRIADNHRVIEAILAEVQRIRAEHHLPIEAPSVS